MQIQLEDSVRKKQENKSLSLLGLLLEFHLKYGKVNLCDTLQEHKGGNRRIQSQPQSLKNSGGGQHHRWVSMSPCRLQIQSV